MPAKKTKAQKAISKELRKFKKGTLKSSSGQKVSSRKQAIAIALSEGARASKKRKKRK